MYFLNGSHDAMDHVIVFLVRDVRDSLVSVIWVSWTTSDEYGSRQLLFREHQAHKSLMVMRLVRRGYSKKRHRCTKHIHLIVI